MEIVGENGMTRRLQEQFRCRQGGRVDAWMVLLVGREAPKFVGSVRQPSLDPCCMYVCIYMCVCVYVYRVYTRVLGGVLLLSPDICW